MNPHDIMDYIFAQAETRLIHIDKLIENTTSKSCLNSCEIIFKIIKKDVKKSSPYIPEKDEVLKINNKIKIIDQKLRTFQKMTISEFHKYHCHRILAIQHSKK